MGFSQLFVDVFGICKATWLKHNRQEEDEGEDDVETRKK